MPEFPGQIRHSNQAYPVIDLTDEGTQFNQTGKSPVRGIGVFGSIDSRSAVTTRYRTKGYLAVVGSTLTYTLALLQILTIGKLKATGQGFPQQTVSPVEVV